MKNKLQQKLKLLINLLSQLNHLNLQKLWLKKHQVENQVIARVQAAVTQVTVKIQKFQNFLLNQKSLKSLRNLKNYIKTL